MRGHLKLIILKMLKDNSMAGSELISKINEDMNWKPSCGSVYPLLNSMEEEGLTKSELINTKKIYKITPKANNFLKEKENEKEELIITMMKSYKLLESVYGFDTSLEREMLTNTKTGEMPFHELYEESLAVKDELVKLQKTGKFSKNIPKIKSIFKETVLELKKIK